MGFGRWAFFEGKIVPFEAAKISVAAPVVNYGVGVFEGIRAYWNPKQKQLWILRLWEHLDRLATSANALGTTIPYTTEQLVQAIVELLQRESYQEDVYIRPLFYAKDGGIGVRLHNLVYGLAIITTPFGNYIPNEEGTKTSIASWRKSRGAVPWSVKAVGNYIHAAAAKTEAFTRGADEAIILNAGETVSEGSASNLFLVKDGVLLTPRAQDNILMGITRDLVMTLAKEELGIPTDVRTILGEELLSADEIFLCGTGVQIAAVTKIDNRLIGTGKIGPITRALRDLYFGVVRGEQPRYHRYLTPTYPTSQVSSPRPNP